MLIVSGYYMGFSQVSLCVGKYNEICSGVVKWASFDAPRLLEIEDSHPGNLYAIKTFRDLFIILWQFGINLIDHSYHIRILCIVRVQVKA